MIKDYEAFANFGDVVLRRMREDADLSQMELAERLGVSMNTISHWEQGWSCPSATQAWSFYRACGLTPTPYIMEWQFPDRFADKDADITDMLQSAVALMQPDDQKRLLYAITGDHGSFWPGVLQLIMAHLHLPLKDRIESAKMIENKTYLLGSKGNLVHTNKPMPNMDLLSRAIQAGETAYSDDKESYTL